MRSFAIVIRRANLKLKSIENTQKKVVVNMSEYVSINVGKYADTESLIKMHFKRKHFSEICSNRY